MSVTGRMVGGPRIHNRRSSVARRLRIGHYALVAGHGCWRVWAMLLVLIAAACSSSGRGARPDSTSSRALVTTTTTRRAFVPSPRCAATPKPHAPTKSKAPRTGTLTLVAGPYGFLVPRGWNRVPLTNYGGPASYALFSNPDDANQTITYESNGGSFGLIYGRDGAINTAGMRTILAGENIASARLLAANELAYSCRRRSPALETRGVIRVRPAYQGWLRVEVTLPRKDDPVVGRVLASLH